MEFLPITIEQCISILDEQINKEQRNLLSDMTFSDFKSSNYIKKLNIINLFGLDSGNMALLEHCTKIVQQNNTTPFVEIIPIKDAEKIILLSFWEKLVF